MPLFPTPTGPYTIPQTAGSYTYPYYPYGTTPYQQSNSQTPIQNQAPTEQNRWGNNFVWVQGEAAAKAYPVAAGNTVLLMDSENPVIYIKSSDNGGRPMPMETYDLVRRETTTTESAPAKSPNQSYVTVEELERRLDEFGNKFVIRKERNNGKSTV